MSRTFRLYYPVLPTIAEQAPHRAVYVGEAEDRCQIFAWNRRTGTTRQVTDRPAGTTRAALDPAGDTVWWFDDDLGGTGRWQLVDFAGFAGPRPALPATASGRPAGLAMAADGTAVIGLTDERGLTLHVRHPDGSHLVARRLDSYAYVVDVDAAGRLIVVGADPAATDAVTVYTADGRQSAVLAGGPDRRVWALGFALGTSRLLLVVEADGDYRLATWTPREGLRHHDAHRFPTEITACWYPDGEHVLVRQDRYAESRLYRVNLAAADRAPIAVRAGSVLDAAVWPDGDVAYVWTDAATPPQLCSTGGMALPAEDGAGPRTGTAPAARRGDIWVPGPGGDIHALVTTPAERTGPAPAVFLVHGGPSEHARNAYDPVVDLLVHTGCAVVRVNYRGSSGYGAAWRSDFSAGVGHTQLEDLAAVRRRLVDDGVVLADRTALWGHSWGGYLTLLAVGVQPDLWRLGIAVTPIADYVAAFHGASPAVRALDRTLFGGTPDDVLERYLRASPVSYVDQVRAPVFLAVATDDVRCPPEPVEQYAALLTRRGVPNRLLRLHAGHEDVDARNHVALMQAVLPFMQRHFDGVRDEGTPIALALARPAG